MGPHFLWIKKHQILHLSHVFLLAIEETAFFPATCHCSSTCIPRYSQTQALSPRCTWCFPTHKLLFMLFAPWDVYLLLVKSYVNPTIVIILLFKTLFCSPKKTIQWKLLTEEANKTGWHKPLALLPSNLDFHVPSGGRKLMRNPVHCFGERTRALPEWVSFSLLLERWILPK